MPAVHSYVLSILYAIAFVVTVALYRFTQPPAQLRHIPRIPVWQLCVSYLFGEVEEQRVKRILLPFANKHRADIVLVWCFGEWMVHIVDSKVGKAIMENRSLKKQQPPAHMLFWQLTGRENIFFSDGAQWQRHSRIFKAALQRTAPMEQFAALARRLCALVGDGGRVCWNDLAHRFTLDAVGTTVLGYDFEALGRPEGSLITLYNSVMAAVADPLYVFVPAMERWRPRRQVRKELDMLVVGLSEIMAAKKADPGDDVITYMYEEPELTYKELRDNTIVLFMAGHDSTAGSISSLIFLLGLYPDVQARARAEVTSILRPGEEVRAEHFAQMPYLRAVLLESLRFNNPANVTLPRVADVPVQAGALTIPPGTPIVLNMSAVLHNARLWRDPLVFDPERFLRSDDAAGDGDGDGEKGNAESWMPFGHGPHQCPARNFAMLEQRTVAIALLRQYKWSIPEDSIHRKGIRNAFSTFTLSLPYDVNIERLYIVHRGPVVRPSVCRASR